MAPSKSSNLLTWRAQNLSDSGEEGKKCNFYVTGKIAYSILQTNVNVSTLKMK